MILSPRATAVFPLSATATTVGPISGSPSPIQERHQGWPFRPALRCSHSNTEAYRQARYPAPSSRKWRSIISALLACSLSARALRPSMEYNLQYEMSPIDPETLVMELIVTVEPPRCVLPEERCFLLDPRTRFPGRQGAAPPKSCGHDGQRPYPAMACIFVDTQSALRVYENVILNSIFST